MQPAADQRLLDRLVPLLAGATVVAFAAGSSSVPRITNIGHPLRWGFLVLLLVGAFLWSLPRPAVQRAPVVAAASFVALALLSSLWSVERRTTFERAASLGLLFLTCLLLAAAVAARPDRARALLVGILGGAVVVGLLGLLLLAVDYGRAVEAASYEAPARYRGFGQDPNTVALLFAVVVPLAVWAVYTARRTIVAVLVLALFVGTIVGSGSRGGLVAGAVGALVVVLAMRRRALAAAALVLVVAAVGAGIASLPKPNAAGTVAAKVGGAAIAPKPGYLNAEASYPLSADIGQPLPGGGQPPVRRSFFGGSGRVDAWTGALHEAARRPIAGHGFGTEQAVFVDRYYRFVGGLPENSYIGIALQLGAVGVIALLSLAVILALSGLRALRRPRPAFAAACIGVLAAGLVAGLFQSYLYSVGNIAAAALWVPGFLLAVRSDG